MGSYMRLVPLVCRMSDEIPKGLIADFEPHWTIFKQVVLPEVARQRDQTPDASDEENAQSLRVVVQEAYSLHRQSRTEQNSFTEYISQRLCARVAHDKVNSVELNYNVNTLTISAIVRLDRAYKDERAFIRDYVFPE